MIPSLKILFNQIKVRSKKKKTKKQETMERTFSPYQHQHKKPPLITSQFLDFKVVYLKTD